MTAFAIASNGDVVVDCDIKNDIKTATLRFKGPTSYDTGGSTIDLSSAQTSLLHAYFTEVHKVDVEVETAGSLLHVANYLAAASYAPATGKIAVHSGGSQISNATDLSGTVYRIRVRGR
jgi:hypothetical protein